MQIGPATPWNATIPHAPTPARGTAAPPEGAEPSSGPAPAPPGKTRPGDIHAGDAASGKLDPFQRPPEEQAQITELRRRDQEVRQHEAAHIAAGGAHVRGGASYSYQPGPDGKRYAVGGEVSIDASPVAGNPEATIAKMRQVRSAALAPATPSGQDLAVAARASQAEMQARMEAAAPEPQRAEGEDGAAQETWAPSTPADALQPAPMATGSLIDAYA